MIDTIDRVLEKYEISHYGFLPVIEPLSVLPDSYFQPWESIIQCLPDLIKNGQFYEQIAKLPVLNVTRLTSIPEWRRAYVILTFLTHAHTWSDSMPHEILPPSISIPLLDISNHLGLPPTATYPALNLWNCGLISDDADITNPENVVMRHTFTGTPDESWFYAVSVSIEAKGVRAIQVMLECVDAVDDHEDTKIHEYLVQFSDILVELGTILNRMHERCDPQVFYHQIRPFLAGSRGMEKAGLPRGLFYDEGDARGSWRQYSGGSNAQSTLIQFLDIALGVQHEGHGSSKPPPLSTTSIDPTKTKGQPPSNHRASPYLTEMRTYMPISHRLFLDHFTSIANIRTYATSPSTNPAITSAFNTAVDALTAFRDIHIRIVGRYIVAPSRIKSQSGKEKSEGNVVNIASTSSRADTKKNELKGTGGTNLMEFLKRTRDETRMAGTTMVV